MNNIKVQGRWNHDHELIYQNSFIHNSRIYHTFKLSEDYVGIIFDNDGKTPIAVDPPDGPFMGLGYQIENLSLDSINADHSLLLTFYENCID